MRTTGGIFPPVLDKKGWYGSIICAKQRCVSDECTESREENSVMVGITEHGFDAEQASKTLDSLIEQYDENPDDQNIVTRFIDDWEGKYDIWLDDFDNEVSDLVRQWRYLHQTPQFFQTFFGLVEAHPLQCLIREALERMSSSQPSAQQERMRYLERHGHRHKQGLNRKALHSIHNALVRAWDELAIGKLWKSIVYKRSFLGALMFYHHTVLRTTPQDIPGFFRGDRDRNYQQFIENWKQQRRMLKQGKQSAHPKSHSRDQPPQSSRRDRDDDRRQDRGYRDRNDDRYQDRDDDWR